MALKRLLLLASAFTACFAYEKFQPESITYDELLSDDLFSSNQVLSRFRNEIETRGILAVSDIPGLAEVYAKAVEQASRCSKVSDAAKTSVFADGTKRTTLASTFSVSAGYSPVNHGGNFPACNDFDVNSLLVREIVSLVSSKFTERLSEEFVSRSGTPFLQTKEGKRFDSILSVVNAGNHLDHFHSYSKKPTTKVEVDMATIDFHTDQGLFIAFLPAKMLKSGSNDAGQFVLQFSDMSLREVVFANDMNTLVFMMGDGMKQFVNPKLSVERQIYVPPHALTMSAEAENERLWFGRMFLAPEEAILEPYGLSFGEIQELTVESLRSGTSLSTPTIGCSGGRVSRELSEDSCLDDTIFCWSRCMNTTAYGLYYDGFAYSEDNCLANGFNFMECVHPSTDTIYNATVQAHGGFRPACTNSTTQYVASPLITQPDNEECNFANFVAEGKSKFTDGEWRPSESDDFVVQWKLNNRFSTSEDEVCFRVAYNGIAGWLSIGLYNAAGQELQISTDGQVGSRGNVMIGAPVVMGIFFDEDGQEVGVHEYLIHSSETRFPLWNTPIADNVSNIADSMYNLTDCFSEMQFCTTAFGNRELEMNGFNHFMWGYDSRRTIASKHVPTSRGTAFLDFSFADGVNAPSSSGGGGLDDEIKFALIGGGIGAGSVLLVAAALVFAFPSQSNPLDDLQDPDSDDSATTATDVKVAI
mmetsp:Transcript_3031/g.4086  ORF Transcript_3031/g.4086 Transcript_3031/m.4086 type:complete len:700 (-) Transcript_3031:81-2180(-)